jgi:hypothetical protein
VPARSEFSSVWKQRHAGLATVEGRARVVEERHRQPRPVQAGVLFEAVESGEAHGDVHQRLRGITFHHLKGERLSES